MGLEEGIVLISPTVSRVAGGFTGFDRSLDPSIERRESGVVIEECDSGCKRGEAGLPGADGGPFVGWSNEENQVQSRRAIGHGAYPRMPQQHAVLENHFDLQER